MSKSFPEGHEKAPLGRLDIRSRAGVEFRVLDGLGVEQLRGTGDMQLDLPQGLYSVEWLTAGSRSETLVRVSSADKPAVAMFEPGDAPRAGQAVAQSATDHAKRFQHELPSERDYGAAVAVIVGADKDPGESLKTLRLYNDRDTAMRAGAEQAGGINLARQEAARYFNVPPGDYLLAIRSVTGETMQQSVPALPGRITMIFLSQVAGPLLVADGDKFVTRDSVGIDPARTVMISVTGDEADERIRERVRLAGVLLHDIATRDASLDAGFLSILDDPQTDPLLRLFAAVVVIARIDAKQSPAPDESWPRGAKQSRAFADQWANRALRWLGIDKGVAVAPDETIVRWKLSELLRRKRPLRARRSIVRPPMLAQTWRWAITHSVGDPAAIQQTPANLAAARSAAGADPWLCWKASAGKAPPATTSLTKVALDMLVSAVVEKAGALAARTFSGGIDGALDQLSPDLRLAARQAFDKLAADKGGVAKLAVSFGLPAASLARQLTRVDQELDGAVARLDASETTAPEPVQAPGSRRMIDHPDDPQRGRFGGRPDRDGFALSATFATTRSPNWARIEIGVTGPAADGDVVQFYLHDSFQPIMRAATFAGGRAGLSLTAWGGFTIGAWLPRQAIELELNLAEVEGAPDIIRTR